MSDTPQLDGRRRREIRDHLESIAATYTDQWEPGTDDAGAAVVELFAAMAGDLVERLDQAPEKHRVAFFDTLGFGRRPPQAATVPVTVTVAEGAGQNVAIPSGTEFEAEADGDDLRFRVESADAFEATPARLLDVYCVDPARDRVTAHGDVSSGGDESQLFVGENLQQHALYIGHPERLDLSGEATIELEIEATHEDHLADLEWEYYGESGDAHDEWCSLSRDDPVGAPFTFDLTANQKLVETEQDGIECFWIRCRMPESVVTSAFDIELEDVSFGSPQNEAPVDGLYANDVPQPQTDGTVHPFGSIPRQRDAFYIASEEAFTKRGAEVTVTFDGVEADALDREGVDEVQFSWEYFDGDAWQRLSLAEPPTGDEDFPSEISFTVPESIGETVVAGQEGTWIRARLIAGEFVEIRHIGTENPIRTLDGSPPTFEGLEITHAYDESADAAPAYLLPENNLEYGENAVEESSFHPFEQLRDDTQTVFFGFDRQLGGGPIQLYVDVADQVYPEGFTPRVSWEYAPDEPSPSWRRLSGSDGSDGFTAEGLVALTFPTPSTSSIKFDQERHWLRVRLRGDEFTPPNQGTSDETATSTTISSEETTSVTTDSESADERPTLEPCRQVLGASGGLASETTEPPLVHGIYLNAGRVSNVTVVEDEVLGSSDGSPNATFALENSPVLDVELWVDEHQALSADARDRLIDAAPDRVSVERDGSGDVIAVWVKWEPVDDFLSSGEDDRHFVIDSLAGEIAFGDDTVGRVPPHGKDNIRAEYRTGGGAAGNVAPGEVTDLVSAIALVEAVTNPVAGGGGADGESTAEVLERAPRTLRDRDRAVTAADFERIALDASRRLATVRCIPGINETGDRDPGWVTVVIVPDDRRETPNPSAELRRTVERTLRDSAPLTLIAENRLVVRGPSYVAVGAEATVVAEPGERLGTLEDRIDDHLSEYLHPLTGVGGTGWTFGSLPSVSDLLAEIERVAGVDHVDALRVRYGVDGEDITLVQGESPPDGSPDMLVRSGAHELVLEPYRDPSREDY